MEKAIPSNHRICFRHFELDPYTRELYSNGVRLKVQGQPIGVLQILLEHPGELVTREYLQKALWPADTFVDFDHSLNAAVMKLREALGDIAEKPLYIETMPRKGYRFIASLAEPATALKDCATTSATVSRDSSRVSTRIRWLILLGFGSFLASSAAIWYFPRPIHTPRVSYKRLTQDGHDKILAGTDGSRLYFTDGSQFSIHQIAIGGGEPAPVSSTASLGLAQAWDVSRDGSHLLIAQRELGLLPWEMWVVSAVGESKRHLGAAVHGAFSPDGQSIVYSTYQNELWTIRTDGTERRKLTDTKGLAKNLAWSPDDSIIRFTINQQYWEMRSDGSNPHPFLSEWKPAFDRCCGRWSFQGDSFFFLAGEGSFRGGGRPFGTQIWMLNERHGLSKDSVREPIQLSSGPIGWDTPIPGRDGKTIFAEGRARLGELVRVDPKSHQVQPFLNGISAEFVSFAADGKSVAYVTFPDGIAWRADSDGSHPVQISQPPEYAINPVWSPSGSEILFGGITRNSYQAHIVSADGQNSRSLIPNASDPRWSPDGRRIVFETDRTNPKRRRLSIMELAKNTIQDIPHSEGLASPRWSPDGRYIVALSVVPPPRLFNVKTQQWSPLPLVGDINFPAWSRDSRYIYGLDLDSVGGDRWIFRFPVFGGPPERILSLNDWKLTGWCGFSLSLDPADAPLLLRESGSSEIYALMLDRE